MSLYRDPEIIVRPCDVCGGDPEGAQTQTGACVCLECPVCNSTGDPGCSLNGGTKCQSGKPPRCPQEYCKANGRPYCHCQSCGETDRYLTEDGYCAECLKAEQKHNAEV